MIPTHHQLGIPDDQWRSYTEDERAAVRAVSAAVGLEEAARVADDIFRRHNNRYTFTEPTGYATPTRYAVVDRKSIRNEEPVARRSRTECEAPVSGGMGR